MIKDGKLTAKGLDELKSPDALRRPHRVRGNPDVERIGDLYTVEMLVQYVASKLAA